MPDEVPIYSGRVNVSMLARQGDAAAKVANAVLNMEVIEDDEAGVEISDANIVIKIPRRSDGDGSGGLGPVVFAGTASGEIAYFVVNADTTSYSSPPSQYPLANPP